MKQYLALLQDIYEHGSVRKDRTGTGTISVFGRQLRFENVGERFPLVTTKKMFTRGAIEEMLWFISGSTDVNVLKEKNIHIWDAWQREDGTIGHGYGEQMRGWQAIELKEKGRRPNVNRVLSSREDCKHLALASYDQLGEAIRLIKEDPYSRRIIVNFWHVDQIDDMALPPCHFVHQYYVGGENMDELSLHLNIRSSDTFLGLPFNIAQYAALLMVVAQVTEKKAKDLIVTLGDAHVYLNHVEQVKEQLKRFPYELPKMHLNPEVKDIGAFRYEDFALEGYKCHPAIKGEVSV